MYTALVSADTSTNSGFAVVNALILIVLIAVIWPLFRKLRRTLSENRKRRWVEQGLMDPPPADPEADERSG